MAVNNTLFWLILAALILITICLFVIVSLMISEDKEKNRLETKEHSVNKKVTTQECLHFFGYLAEHPRRKPIPDECFGCRRVIECINAIKNKSKNALENMNKVEEVIQI